MKEIIFCRHAEINFSWFDCFFSNARYDFVPLSETGIIQAKRLAEKMRGRVNHIVASPYTRSLQTAAIIAAELQIPFRIDKRIREWAPFKKSSDPVDAVEISRRRSWMIANRDNVSFESKKEMQRRFSGFISDVEDRGLVISHEVFLCVMTERSFLENCEFFSYFVE